MIESQGRPRKQERMWKWVAIITVAVLILLLVIKFVESNLWVFASAAILLALFLWLLGRKEKQWQYVDAVRACKALEFEFTGHEMDDTVGYCQVVPAGQFWLVEFFSPAPVTYTVDPSQQRVIGRQIRRPDDIIERFDKSEILQTYARDNMAKRRAEKELNDLGFDTEEGGDDASPS